MMKKIKPTLNKILSILLLIGIAFSVITIINAAAPNPGHTWLEIGDVVATTSQGGTGLTSPGDSGNVLTSNGTIWTSAAPSGVMTYLGGTQLAVDSATLNVTLSAAKGYMHCVIAGPGASAVGILYLRFDSSAGLADYGSTADYALAGAAFVDTQDASDSEIQLTGTITTSTNLPSMWNIYISNISGQAKQVQWDAVQGKAVGTIGDIFIGQGTYYITTGQIGTSVNFLRSAGNYLAGTYAFCEGRDI